MKKSTEISEQYLIESPKLARSMLLGALRWMKPKNTSASVLPSAVDALLVLSDSAMGEATEVSRANRTFGVPPRVSGGVTSPVVDGGGNVQSVAFDENRSRETRRPPFIAVIAGGSGEIGDGKSVAAAGPEDETPVVAGVEFLYRLPKQELPRLLSMSAGKILVISGFSVGMQAHTSPRLTSTALHMNDIEACQAKLTSLPISGEVWASDGPADCWR